MMRKPPRVTKFSLGAEPTVDTILGFMDMLRDINGSARVQFTKELGQRDQEYNFITITETDW